MAVEEKNLSEEVSEFLHQSYQLLPTNHLQIASYFRGTSLHPVDNIKCQVIPVVTGSTAEFYINPMLKCVGDVDIMYHYANELAIPAGHRLPIELSTDFDSRVKVFEIVDSRAPGYVHLRLTYIISKRDADNEYIIAEHVDRPDTELSHEFYVNDVNYRYRKHVDIYGPSACMSLEIFPNWKVFDTYLLTSKTTDTVPCVRCLEWPTQADDWPTRHRNFGWPDATTIYRVVRNGCDVVGVAHCLCKDDEWMRKHQWRLSFSRAEVVLLNSLTPEQQIIYHMLRHFMTTERLFNGANNARKSTLGNYQIKTMMLWACETKPRHWWTGQSNIVYVFAQCLHFLKEWITKKRGHHYFIKNVYFLDCIDEVSISAVISVIQSITNDYLAEWFVVNYIRRCAERCPDNLPILLSNMPLTKEIVHKTATAILRWKRHIVEKQQIKRLTLEVFSGLMAPLVRDWKLMSKDVFKPRLLVSFIHELARFDRSMIHNNLHCFLKRIDDIGEYFKNTFVDLLAAKEMRKFHRKCTSFSDTASVSCLEKAAYFMKSVADKHPNFHRIVHVSLAKSYLIRALRYNDSDSDSINNLANVYMTVLCYITGKFRKATDHCLLVARTQRHQCCSLRVLDGQLLPIIDDAIDTVLGLAALYQYVLPTTLKCPKQTQHVSVFTAELFAYYINIRHLLVAQCYFTPKTQERHALQVVKFQLFEVLKRFYDRITSTQRLLVTDLILLKLSRNLSSHYQHQPCGIEILASDNCSKQQLVELLKHTPIQQMLKYHQLVFTQDADPQFAAVVNTYDFMALRLYRCKLYERCAQLCQRAVQKMISGQVRPIARLCFLERELVQWTDKDVTSLIGLMVLADKAGRTQSHLQEPLRVSELAMSLYLLSRCQIKILSSKYDRDLSPLADILDWIDKAAEIASNSVLDHSLQKLAERLAIMYINKRLRPFSG